MSGIVFDSSVSFSLSKEFVNTFAVKKPPFGFNGLGELVYMRTYSRVKEDGTREKWHETVERVVNGTFSIQKRWIQSNRLGWSEEKAQKSAQEMFERMFHMKWLPPGRGIWAMGSDLIEKRHLAASLNNCCFVSTKDMASDPVRPFTFMMDAVMLGVGVGFDTRGAGTANVYRPTVVSMRPYVIDDSREGWVDSVGELLKSYLVNGVPKVSFDYSKIRPAGSPIKGFGGTAAGPEGLTRSHQMLSDRMELFLGEEDYKEVTEELIVDIMNIVGMGVVSGGIRRSAQIALGTNNDEYLNLKDYSVNPHRVDFGWTSNNSVYSDVGDNYTEIAKRIVKNGEPGVVWLENARNYSRMNNGPDFKDPGVLGYNPCGEATLSSFELCCLVEVFPNNCDSKEDFLRTLKYAYLYAKTVTLCPTHWPETNRVMLKNRRIGCSISGIAQFLSKGGVSTLVSWCNDGYDKIQELDRIYSDWFAIPRSIKVTSIKPSGTVSLVAGATPGVHFPESRFYIRRVRLSKHSELIVPLREAGYHIEDAVEDTQTVVVEIPIDSGEGVRSASEVSMWEQLQIASLMQKHWADQSVSVTVTFDPETEGPHIAKALEFFQYGLKAVSFLPRVEMGAYPQMPYERISQQRYLELIRKVRPIYFGKVSGEDAGNTESDKYCSNDTCTISA